MTGLSMPHPGGFLLLQPPSMLAPGMPVVVTALDTSRTAVRAARLLGIDRGTSSRTRRAMGPERGSS